MALKTNLNHNPACLAIKCQSSGATFSDALLFASIHYVLECLTIKINRWLFSQAVGGASPATVSILAASVKT